MSLIKINKNGNKISVRAPFVTATSFEEYKVQSNDCMKTVTD
jgi:hypothetical protein